ncbi:hypothetical protein LTR10_021104 [Elasticomyces elasticus]|uniref:Inhibitor of growth protein N-terminal histone-binding domain-containing protein n=1 Tax=Exophiala sideris TaxID=1016849 RepID=A0ABR0J7A4_9EURO|nr:hypothetical protein LTR10_021104 [Elasticomyces elasticus]KAK5028901.1 hypothetical protein LTS07_006282 [Exophiala sideris]KAK5035770.1 hypothetical protein LTR13_005901 [Exophiala sideris]KAK5057405.1 hypothetical protein LTR69_007446 [Exophiala sideris]KAK5181619.1 hypothetical protein LTR44_005818 [Eurotiomycetes sp. CCFEE 6388]
MAENKILDLDDQSKGLLFELHLALRCKHEHRLLLTHVAKAMSDHMIAQVNPAYRHLGLPQDIEAKARQDLDRRLKDIQYNDLVEEFVPKIEDLQELGQKILDIDDETISSELEIKVEEYVEQKKRKRFGEVEQKLEEIENWRKKMRLNIFGDATQATIEEEADVIRSSVEAETVVAKNPPAECTLIDAVPTTPPPKFPTGMYAPSGSRTVKSRSSDSRTSLSPASPGCFVGLSTPARHFPSENPDHSSDVYLAAQEARRVR